MKKCTSEGKVLNKMDLSLFVVNTTTKERVPVVLSPMTKEDVLVTTREPSWQTRWDTEYLQDENKKKYSLKTKDGELVGLAAYTICARYVMVTIVYMESHPESNPTMVKHKKYDGIGKAMIAAGIALSVNCDFDGCVVLEAKTTELKNHYSNVYHAMPLPSFGGPQRFMFEGDISLAIIADYVIDSGKENA